MKTYTDGQLLAILKAKVQASSQKTVADMLGFTQQFICDVLAGRRPITRTLAETLGFVKLENRYRKQTAA